MLRRLTFAAALALTAPLAAGAQPGPVSKPPEAESPPAADKAGETKVVVEVKLPDPAPKPQADPELDAIAETFFTSLKAGQVAKAYQDIWRGTPMEAQPADMKTVIAQTRTALESYGKVVGWEWLREDPAAPSFLTYTYLVRNEVGPLFFRLQFYRKDAVWTVYRVDFADQPGKLP